MNQMNPAVAALRGMRGQKDIMGKEMPANNALGSDANTLYLSTDLFGEKKAVKGQEITVKGQVTSVGNKIGFVPAEIVEGMTDESSDPDLEDEIALGEEDGLKA